ncbi:MAG: Orange carotenoid protein [Chloroflexaceae bacterium]|nr:Orange carotenoid protein [Chloroflexaceae bacterium]
MTAAYANLGAELQQPLTDFDNLSVDQKLAFLWFVYTKMGQSVTPAAPGAAETTIAEGLYNQVKELSHEEQLQVQRDLFSGNSTPISRQYGSLSENTKLLFCYRLAQGMETTEIVPMPENYEMSEQEKQLLQRVEGLEFEQQITFLRETVAGTGSAPHPGSGI